MDIQIFARDKAAEITATALLVAYASLRKKLTTGGIFAGILVAFIHMLHPWPAFFWLLMLFFLFGTLVTRIGHHAKSHLTLSSTGGTGGEGARTSAQVFANSGTACLLILLHSYLLNSAPFISSHLLISAGPYLPALNNLLPIGIISQYAAVAADTFSSELGILAKGQPFMITAPWRRVPRGTNGGVTLAGLGWGLLGSCCLVETAALALYFGKPNIIIGPKNFALLGAAGLAGSVIDSFLGAWAQVTVTDKRSGKVVEGPGGTRVKVLEDGTRVQLGTDLLTNNGVNFVMAALASALAMGVARDVGLGIRAGM